MSSELQIAGVPFSVSNVTGSIESASTHCPADEATNALSTAPIISVGNPNGRMPSRSLSSYSDSGVKRPEPALCRRRLRAVRATALGERRPESFRVRSVNIRRSPFRKYPHVSASEVNGLVWLSRHDRHGRFLRDVQGSVQIGIVKDRPQAGNHLSIGLRVIREYTPDCAKHECKKCVAAPQRPQNGGRTDDVT